MVTEIRLEAGVFKRWRLRESAPAPSSGNQEPLLGTAEASEERIANEKKKNKRRNKREGGERRERNGN